MCLLLYRRGHFCFLYMSYALGCVSFRGAFSNRSLNVNKMHNSIIIGKRKDIIIDFLFAKKNVQTKPF